MKHPPSKKKENKKTKGIQNIQTGLELKKVSHFETLYFKTPKYNEVLCVTAVSFFLIFLWKKDDRILKGNKRQT